MSKKEQLKVAKTALESIQHGLAGLNVLIKQGNKVTVIVALKHMEQRCKEILQLLE